MAYISPQAPPSVKVYQAEIVYENENTNYDCHFLNFFVYKRQQLFRKVLPCRKPLLDGFLKVEVAAVVAVVCNVHTGSSGFDGYLLLRKSVTRFRGRIKSQLSD